MRSAMLLSIAATMLLAACGGETNNGDFASEADAICTDAARTQIEATIEFGPGLEPADEALRLGELQASGEGALELLGELSPPDGSADSWDDYLENRRASNAAIQRQSDAIANDERDAAAAAADELEQLLAERDAIGDELGLEACARSLPDGDEDAVKESVELASVSADGDRVCAEAVSAVLLERQFEGDADRCARAQRLAKSSDSVVFDDVIGVAEVLATAEVQLVGGALDGTDATLTLLYEEGAYKVLSASTAPAG